MAKAAINPATASPTCAWACAARDRAWEVEGWVRNLFDRNYITAVYSLLGTGDYGVMTGSERTLGTTVRLRY
nr:hypothetical protein GCM10020185_18830 [Pseudomonas brassicacearum subsp. brassicacearum]